MSAPGYVPPLPPPIAMTPAEPALLGRPPGVTFGLVSSIVLGAMGAFVGLIMLAMGAAFAGLLPVVGAIVGAFFLLFALVLGGMGVMGMVAGGVGLNGASWARWTVVVLHSVGAVLNLAGFPFSLPLLGVNVAAIVCLVNAPANAWYEQQARA